MLALVLALSTSLCWGVADFLGGLQARRRHVLVVLLISQAVSLAGLAVVVAARGQAPPDIAKLLPAAAAGVAGVAGLTAFYQALAIGTMSIVAPVSATGVCIPIIVGIAGGERPAALQIAGILAACGGVILATRESEEDEHRAAASRASILLALVAAVGFGVFTVGLRASARSDVLWTLCSERVASVAAVAIAVGVLVRRGAITRAAAGPARTMPPVVLIGVLDLCGVGLYALASRRGLLSIVAVGASLYPLVTVLLARTVLRERVQRIQEVGIAAAVLGVVMIAGG